MTPFRNISDIRREYGDLCLEEHTAPEDPLLQFKKWFEEVLKYEKTDPTAMVLSTVDQDNHPDSRVVLLKGIEEGNFIFYTNYLSTKAMQMQHNPYAALNFFWPEMARQVRIRGRVKKVSKEQSDTYFSSRPLTSQLSAIVSPQSQEIQNRNLLENQLNELIKLHGQEPVIRPDHWGGYMILPDEIEFWQGRDNRLHDRIHYFCKAGQWQHRRLAP